LFQVDEKMEEITFPRCTENSMASAARTGRKRLRSDEKPRAMMVM
jgi:hypothetical protein